MEDRPWNRPWRPRTRPGLGDDVDAAVAEFRQKVQDAGLQACRDGFTAQWTAYCEEYGYQ